MVQKWQIQDGDFRLVQKCHKDTAKIRLKLVSKGPSGYEWTLD